MTRPDKRDLDVVEQWCRAQDPELEVRRATNAVTIVSRAKGCEIARLRYSPADAIWTLYQIDGAKAEGWSRFEWAKPAEDLEDLLEVVAEDPTGVFWG